MGAAGSSFSYFKNYSGIYHSICKEASPITHFSNSANPLFSSRHASSDGEPYQSRHFGNINLQDGVHVKNVPRHKIGRRSTASPKFKGAKQFSRSQKVSFNKSSKNSPISSDWGLFGKNRSVTSLFPHTRQSTTSSFSFCPLSRKDPSVHLPAFWPFDSSSSVRKNFKLASCSAAGTGNKSRSLLRRFSVSKPKSVNASKRLSLCNSSIRISRMGNQLPEVDVQSQSVSRVFGNSLESFGKLHDSSKKKDSFNSRRPKKNSQDRFVELGKGKMSIGKDEFCLVRSSIGPASLSAFAKSSESSAYRSKEKAISPPVCSDSRVSMVDEKCENFIPFIQSPRNSLYNVRRLRHRMGCCCKRYPCRGALEAFSETLAHKPKGALCRFSSYSSEYSNPTKQKSSYSIRQPHHYLLHKKRGGDKICDSYKPSIQASASSLETQHRAMPLLSPRHVQRYSRQSVETEASGRLASFNDNNQYDLQAVGNSRDRSLCNESIKSGTKLCVPRSEGQGSGFYGCFQQDVGVQVSLDLSSTFPNTQNPGTSNPSNGHLYSSSTEVGESILESGSKEQSNRSTSSYQQSSGSSHRRVYTAASTQCQKPSFGGLEGTGWSNIVSNWSKEDQILLTRSWRESSFKTYRAPWKAWVNYCQPKGLNPTQPDAEKVAEYIGYLHRIKKLSAATIRLHKSVILTMSNPLCRETLSSNVLIKQMLKAVELSRPPAAKKMIWDVAKLIDWMKHFVVDENSIFQVSRHLALILLLASGRRVHDLTLLRIDQEYLLLKEDSLTFWPVFGSKTDKGSYRQSGWFLSQIPEHRLDPVYWTKKCISLSRKRRSSVENLNSLFITSRGQVGPASRSIIAGWIATVFSLLDIHFSPGSIRSAVASSRKDNELPLDLIMKNGNWTSKQNVFKFYFKEVVKSNCDSSSVNTLLNHSFKPV